MTDLRNHALAPSTFDRDASDALVRPSASPLAPGVPVDSSEGVTAETFPGPTQTGSVAPSGPPLVCDSCQMRKHCNGVTSFCECDCAFEEFVPHENDEVADAIRSEGWYPTADQLIRERYGEPVAGWCM